MGLFELVFDSGEVKKKAKAAAQRDKVRKRTKQIQERERDREAARRAVGRSIFGV